MTRLLLALSLTLAAPAMPAIAAPSAPFMIAEYEPAVEEAIKEGKQALEDGHYEQALSCFQDAAAATPDDPGIQALIKEAQTKACADYVEQGHAAIAKKAYAEALTIFENALDLLPDNAEAKKGKKLAENWPKADALVKEAKARYAKGELDHAVKYFQDAYDLTGDAKIKGWLEQAKAVRKK